MSLLWRAPLEPGALEYVKLLGWLGGIILLAFFMLRYGLPRLAGVHASPHGPIRIAARLVLEPRRTLYIVKAGGEYMLLGVSEAGIRHLRALDAEGVERALAEAVQHLRPKALRRQ